MFAFASSPCHPVCGAACVDAVTAAAPQRRLVPLPSGVYTCPVASCVCRPRVAGVSVGAAQRLRRVVSAALGQAKDGGGVAGAWRLGSVLGTLCLWIHPVALTCGARGVSGTADEPQEPPADSTAAEERRAGTALPSGDPGTEQVGERIHEPML
jgi:hypothetical protein